jgi:hypothetical protein
MLSIWLALHTGKEIKIPELLEKVIYRWFWVLSAIAVICLASLYLYPSIIYSDMLYIVCIYVVVETIVLAVVLSILRKLSMFTSWKLTAYYAVVVAGSVSTNYLSPEHGESFLPTVLAVVVILVFLNVILSKIILVISVRKACLIGTIMGLINAFMVIAATPVCK